MISVDQHHPPAPLRSAVLRSGTLAFLVVAAISFVVRPWLHLGGLYPGKAMGVFAAGMALAVGHLGAHRPYVRFGPANHVTMIRAMAVALIASLIGESGLPRAAVAASMAAVFIMALDGLDGWLARRSRMVSVFGARFDVETDAFFILVMSVLVWQHGKAGAWVLAGGLMRYLFVLSGAWLRWMARPLEPTQRAKAIAVVHMVGLTIALPPFVHVPFSTMAAGATTAALIWSFAVDVRRLWRMEQS